MNVLRKINNNISEIILLAILISLPLPYAVNSIAVILFFIYGVYNAIIKKQKIHLKGNNIFILLVLFYILCLLSLFWTDNAINTQNGLQRFLSYLIIPLAFVFNNVTNISKKKILNYFSYSLVFYIFYCLILGVSNAINNSDISYLFYHKLSNNLSGLNAIYLSVFVSFAYGYFLNKNNKSKIDLLCMFFLFFFLMLLSSKIIIGITLLLSIFFLTRRKGFKKSKIDFKIISILITVSVILIFASSNIRNRIKTEYNKTAFEEVLIKKEFGGTYLWTGLGLRIFQAKAFYEILLEKKKYVLGSGLNNSQESLNDKYKQYKLYKGFLNYNYHNQYLQVFAELGFIGFLALIFILFIPLIKATRQKDFLLFYFIILIATVCLTESFLWRQMGMVFFITMLLLLNKEKEEHKASIF